MFKHIFKLLFILLAISCSKANNDGPGSKSQAPGESTISLAPGQEAATTELPIRFHLQLPSDFDPSTLKTSDLTNAGTATSVNFQVSPLGNNLFEVRVSSTDGFGTITPTIDKPEKGIEISKTTPVTFSSKTSAATLLKTFKKKFESANTKVEYVFKDQSKFLFSSSGDLYSSTGDAFSNVKILKDYTPPYTKENFLQVGQSLLFSSLNDGDHYLYVTNGTTEGTKLIGGPQIDSTETSNFFADISGSFTNYFETTNYVYFGFGESWSVVKILKINKSDFSIDAVISGTGCNHPGSFGFMGETNQKVIFWCRDGSGNYKARSLDIVSDTTDILDSIDLEVIPFGGATYQTTSNSVNLNDDRLLFLGRNGSNNNFNLFVTDGTDAGTSLYGDISLTENLNRYSLSKDSGNNIYVYHEDKLLVLNQTTESFSNVFTLGTGYYISDIVHTNDFIYSYGGKSVGGFVSSFRRSDGLVSEGTLPTFHQSSTRYAGMLDGAFYIKQSTYNGTIDEYSLVRMDGTTYDQIPNEDNSGTPLSPYEVHIINNDLYLLASTSNLRYNLYKFNGSDFTPIDPNNLNFNNVYGVFSFKENLIFTANDSVSFEELWRHDPLALTNEKMFQMGTTDHGVKASKFFKFGTDYYATINDNENGGEVWQVGSNSTDISRITDTYSSSKGLDVSCESTSTFFACLDDTTSWTSSIWSFDPSTNSLTQYSDDYKIYELSDNNYNYKSMFSHGEKIYFNMRHSTLAESPTGLVSFDGSTLTNAADSTGHSFDYDITIAPGDGNNVIATNYWDGALITDGSGTNAFSLLTDIGDGKYGIAHHNGYYYITGRDSSWDYHMWITDGTTPGTRLLVDFKPPGQDESYQILGPGVGANFIYATDDTVNGYELWTTDGTPGGTNLLKDIIPGSGSLGWNLYYIANLSNYAVLELEVNSNQEIWITDNTGAGTSRVLDGFTRSYGSYVSGDKVFFDTWTSPDDSCQLHVVDGSTGTLTSLVTTTNETVDNKRCSRHFFDYGGKTYFLAHTPSAGIELWETDGTAQGTKISQETLTGTDSLFSKKGHPYMQVIGSELLFWGYDSVNSTSLWKLTL